MINENIYKQARRSATPVACPKWEMCSRKLKNNHPSSLGPDGKQPTKHIAGDHDHYLNGGAGDSSTIRMADIADDFSVGRKSAGDSLTPPNSPVVF